MPKKLSFMKKFAKNTKITKFLSTLAIGLTFAFLILKIGGNAKRAINAVFGFNLQNHKIPIVMATDENYVYPTIVTLTSMFDNAKENTKYEVIIMHPGELPQKSKEKIFTLNYKYPKHKILFYDMKNEFKEISVLGPGAQTTPTYYRLKIPSILPYVSKCLWIDSDTLIFKDLNEMYDVDMSNYYVAGINCTLRDQNRLIEFGIKDDQYICAGVMVMNLDLIRRENLEQKMFDILSGEHKDLLIFNDQDVINISCYGKILDLHPKFGILSGMFPDGWAKDCTIEESQLNEAMENPHIIHYALTKPWLENQEPYKELWWEYAAKTEFYKEICQKYKND